ncbi:hypothetical protein [Microbispora sp. KK1-11]|uniref:hypothetical protein n=1 Tax=Microbispora sp. KK1-11 TaxID=2053005 RepID=UPI0011572F06|nr:hypothetical protein [Microbispora sp. KK1-11]TQS29456.1 hypothetical protein FLW16_10790 [Microbispora sp. KK1-11]
MVSVVVASCLSLVCQPAHAALASAEQGLRVAAEVVEYECTTDDVTETQDVKINVELTMPDNATAGQQMSIGWRGTYVTGSELRAPAAGLTAVKLYAYAALTGIEDLTSATGVSEPLSITAGQTIPLPEAEVSMKTTSSRAGTATVRPAAINIGPSPTAPVIECEVRNASTLTTYTLTVAQGGQASTSPTADRTTTSPKPTRTVTATVTAAATDDADLDQEIPAAQEMDATPVGGAATGGGGEAGPDGRMYVLTGLAIILAACAGLLLRRRFRSG